MYRLKSSLLTAFSNRISGPLPLPGPLSISGLLPFPGLPLVDYLVDYQSLSIDKHPMDLILEISQENKVGFLDLSFKVTEPSEQA